MQESNAAAGWLKFASITVVALLVVIAGLLVSLHWRMSASNNAAQPEPPAVAAVAEPAMQEPAAAVMAPVAAAPAPVAARRPAAAAARAAEPAPVPVQVQAPQPVQVATGNYTQPAEPMAAPTYAAPAAVPQPSLVLPPAPPVAAARPVDSAPAPAVQAQSWATIPAGAVLGVRLVNTLHSDQVRAGDRFRATLDEPLYSGGNIVAPRGSTVMGEVVYVEKAGRVTGLSEMSVELTGLLLGDGRVVNLLTDTVMRQGPASKAKDAAKIGTGAAIGAVIGAIAGGGKGAAVGAATGAGGAGAGVLLDRGEPVVLTPETRLLFQLRAPVSFEATAYHVESYGESYGSAYPANPSGGGWENERPRLQRRYF